MSNPKQIIKNFFLTLSGIVIVLGLYIKITKNDSASTEVSLQNVRPQTDLAENGQQKTPQALKEYLTPLFKIGFKENLGLDPQASASVDVPKQLLSLVVIGSKIQKAS